MGKELADSDDYSIGDEETFYCNNTPMKLSCRKAGYMLTQAHFPVCWIISVDSVIGPKVSKTAISTAVQLFLLESRHKTVCWKVGDEDFVLFLLEEFTAMIYEKIKRWVYGGSVAVFELWHKVILGAKSLHDEKGWRSIKSCGENINESIVGAYISGSRWNADNYLFKRLNWTKVRPHERNWSSLCGSDLSAEGDESCCALPHFRKAK